MELPPAKAAISGRMHYLDGLVNEQLHFFLHAFRRDAHLIGCPDRSEDAISVLSRLDRHYEFRAPSHWGDPPNCHDADTGREGVQIFATSSRTCSGASRAIAASWLSGVCPLRPSSCPSSVSIYDVGRFGPGQYIFRLLANYLIELESRPQQRASTTMPVDSVKKRFDITPERLIADANYNSIQKKLIIKKSKELPNSNCH